MQLGLLRFNFKPMAVSSSFWSRGTGGRSQISLIYCK